MHNSEENAVHTLYAQGSEAHAHKLAFYLLSKKAPEKSGRGLGKGEIDFLEEIRKDRDVESALEAATSEIEMRGAALEEEDDNDPPADAEPPKKRAKKQTAYDFFREMRQMGLKPIDG